MMKKSLLTLAAIAALTSCSQDDLMNNTDSQASDAIGVNVFVPTASRGTAYNSTSDFNKEGNTFDLIAICCKQGNSYRPIMKSKKDDMENVIDGVEFIYNNGGWDYKNNSEISFWIEAKESTVTFYAVSPAKHTNLTKEFNPGDWEKLYYTVPTDCSEQVDLMYATATVEVDENGDPKQNEVDCKNGVNIEFKHALSQILFQAKTESSKISAKIESITVNNVCSKGTFTYTRNDNGTIFDDYKWTLPDSENGQLIEEYQALLKDDTKIGNTATVISKEPLLLMPQEGARSISVKFSLYIEGLSVPIYEGTLEDIPLQNKWEQGHKYTYTLIFSNELANPIKIGSVSVADWTDSENDTTLNNSSN